MFTATTATSGDMTSMFENAAFFTGKNVNNMQTGEVVKMNSMFKGATVFNSAVASSATTTTVWNVAKVTDFISMFEEARLFNQDVSTWALNADVVNTGLTSMFKNAAVFNGGLFNLDTTDTTDPGGDVTDLTSFLEGAAGFNRAFPTTWAVNKVATFTNMFKNAAAFNVDISAWNVANGINFPSMFEGATSFNVSLGAWAVDAGTTYTDMFKNANNFQKNLCDWQDHPATDGDAFPDSTMTGADATMFTGTKCNGGTFAEGTQGDTSNGVICCACSGTNTGNTGCT